MARKQRAGKSDKSQYIGYETENRWLKNKIKKLTKYCLHFPGDLQAQQTLDKAKKGQLRYNRNGR